MFRIIFPFFFCALAVSGQPSHLDEDKQEGRATAPESPVKEVPTPEYSVYFSLSSAFNLRKNPTLPTVLAVAQVVVPQPARSIASALASRDGRITMADWVKQRMIIGAERTLSRVKPGTVAFVTAYDLQQLPPDYLKERGIKTVEVSRNLFLAYSEAKK